jgi:hypothetical protein
MAIVRGLAFKVNAGPARCGSYQAAWDASLGLDRLLMAAVRVLRRVRPAAHHHLAGLWHLRRPPAGAAAARHPMTTWRGPAWTLM